MRWFDTPHESQCNSQASAYDTTGVKYKLELLTAQGNALAEELTALLNHLGLAREWTPAIAGHTRLVKVRPA